MDATRPPLNKIAILIGVSVDIVGILVTLVGVFVVMGLTMGLRGQPVEERAIELWPQDPVFLTTAFVLGTVSLVVAGFVAGKVAKRDHVRHAAWVGGVILVVYVLFAIMPVEGPSEPLWYEALSIMSTVPAAMLGGYLAAPRLPAIAA